MPVIRWEDPPPSAYPRRKERRRNPAHDETAEMLRANPNRWAVILETTDPNKASLATHIRGGQITAFQPGGFFDACSRKVQQRIIIFAKYVGDGDVDGSAGK